MAETFKLKDGRISRLFGLLFIGEAIACIFFAIAHLSLRIPLGFATLHEPRVIPATIVEMLCGIVLAVGGLALLTHHPRAWSAAIAAQAFTLGGFILGVVASSGNGGSDPVNDVFHRVMLVLLIPGLLGSIAMYRRGHGHAWAFEDGGAI